MPVQFPTLSTQEQTDRVARISKNTLFPYSFSFINQPVADTGGFPKSKTYPASSVAFNYFTMGFKADNNLAISALELIFSINVLAAGAATLSAFIFEVSYSDTLSDAIIDTSAATVPVVPTLPSDRGNVIYRNLLQTTIPSNAGTAFPPSITDNDYRRYEPYNYLLKFNQTIYMHVGLDATTLAVNQPVTMAGSFIFHAVVTGVKI